MKESKKKYLYGIIRKPENFAGQEELVGVEGQKVDLVNFRNLSAVVSDVQEKQDEESLLKKDNIFAHERIIANLMNKFGIILPISFGTLAQNDQVLLKNILQNNYSLLEKTISQLQGKIEVILKASWRNLKFVVDDVVRQDPWLKARKGESNLTFWDWVEIGQLVSEKVQAKRKQLQDRCLGYLKNDYLDFQELPIYQDETIFNLAFLVSKEKEENLRKGFGQVDEKIGDPNIVFHYSQPMAPYNFVELLLQV